MTSEYRPTLPERGPSAADLAERDAFAKLAAESLSVTRKSAETWRTGLSAFVTLVTAGVVVKGRDSTSAMTTEWRLAVTLLLGGGLILAVLGLWQVLGVQAGIPKSVTLETIRARFASVAAFEVSIASDAADGIRRAQKLVAVALCLLIGGVVATWWAPAAPARPPAYLKVEHGSSTSCGELQSADDGQIRLKVSGAGAPVVIPAASVANMAVVAACS
ncbi:hypothetical protein JIG36_40530 [Actinoplanes sp. LDG1-06]|uniref:Uncharacterized protein n=1 Tax=Paractinoplanes ovalisporus TaxID=2810368 RepID=A0ABS2APQ4_9ACTN|nr:hypothetical protein [Actinoplanes ovalisporus]MBM2621810.1 hypothetical protein [Actinoplanes ovalisporus]